MIRTTHIILITILFLSLSTFQVQAQQSQQFYISGFVNDAATGERLIGANVSIESINKGVATDNLGYFVLQVEPPVNIIVSYLGYKNEKISITNNEKKLFHVALSPLQTDLGEVEIVARPEILTQQFNVSTLSSKEIESIPVLGGKPDVIKVAQLLPGIEPMNEATSTMIVRGGNPGENNYLFDNVPVIHVSHLGGFISVFNPDMINSIDIYKGGFPAKYGDKLSSIVNITQREGDKSHYKGSFSAGITDVSFSVEGPGGLKNSSFIITGRKSFFDLYYLGVSSIAKLVEAQDYSFIYGFHDINAKYSWQMNEKNSFHFNIYQGDDYMKIWMNEKDKQSNDRIKLNMGNTWGNLVTSGSWNHVVSPKLFVSNTLSYSQYRLKNKQNFYSEMAYDTLDYLVTGKSDLRDILLQSNWKYSVLKNWNMEFGASASFIISNPNKYYNYYSDIATIADRVFALNSSAYLDNNFRLFNRIDASLGVRIANYYSEGYNNFSVEPRANINVKVAKNHVLNASYMRVTQNAHLLFTAGSILNNEIWVPAGKDIESSYSDQASIGWRGEFLDGMLSAEVDVYYKKLYNLATYKEGYSNIIGDGNWRNKIMSGGKGTSKGIEFLMKKNTGALTGFVSYTFSKTTRQYDLLNNGLEYPFEYDRPHSLSIDVGYQFNKKWSVNALWVFRSGMPYTPVIAEQSLPYIDIETGEIYYKDALIFGERNSERMSPYHRLDLAAKYSKIGKRGRKVEWTFSIYNAYCQQNAFYYYYDNINAYKYKHWQEIPEGDNRLALYKLTYFPVVPSVSYKVYFDKTTRQPNTHVKKKLVIKDGELRRVEKE
ncbi:TonB-dependent receptor [Odoribacter sp. OttesenSCG-928-L07]|nr:TonB-dependent receptor [Odoribacter sp. OttesenSCG-928-L07]